MTVRYHSSELIIIALRNGFGVKDHEELDNYVIITRNDCYYVAFPIDYLPTDTYKRIRCMLEK